MQEAIMPHADPDIVVMSVDADGCYLGRSVIENCPYEPTPDQVAAALKHNGYLIEDVLLVRPYDSDLLIYCGSARNCLASNYKNANPRMGAGSYYPYLEGLQQYFQGLGVNTRLDRFLLADMYYDRAAGATWKVAVSKAHYDAINKFEALIKQKYDETSNRLAIYGQMIDFQQDNKELFESLVPHNTGNDKTNLLLAQIHRVVAKNPGKKIEFRFYDDRYEILTALQKITALQIPQGVTFVALQHQPNSGKLTRPKEVFRIQGVGNLNPQYYQKSSLEILRSIQAEMVGAQSWELSGRDRVSVNIAGVKLNKKIEITLAMDQILGCIQKAKTLTAKFQSDRDIERECAETLRKIMNILKSVYQENSQSKANNFYKKWFDVLEERFCFSIASPKLAVNNPRQARCSVYAQREGIRKQIAGHPYFHVNLNETLANAILANRPVYEGNFLFCPANHSQQFLLCYKVVLNNNGIITTAIRNIALNYNHQTKLIENASLKGALSLQEVIKRIPEFIDLSGLLFVPQPICNHATQILLNDEFPQMLGLLLGDHDLSMRQQEEQRQRIATLVYKSLDKMLPAETLAKSDGSKIIKHQNRSISSPFWASLGKIVFWHNQAVLYNVTRTEILKHAVQQGEDPTIEDSVYKEFETICSQAESSHSK